MGSNRERYEKNAREVGRFRRPRLGVGPAAMRFSGVEAMRIRLSFQERRLGKLVPGLEKISVVIHMVNFLYQYEDFILQFTIQNSKTYRKIRGIPLFLINSERYHPPHSQKLLSSPISRFHNMIS